MAGLSFSGGVHVSMIGIDNAVIQEKLSLIIAAMPSGLMNVTTLDIVKKSHWDANPIMVISNIEFR